MDRLDLFSIAILELKESERLLLQVLNDLSSLYATTLKERKEFAIFFCMKKISN